MSTKYRMRKLSVAIKKSGAHFFMGVCGAYNNVHKLSIHFIALSVNLVPLFHHLPHIYSPFAIHTNSHSSFNPFFGPDLQLVLSRAFFFSHHCQIWIETRSLLYLRTFCIFAKIRMLLHRFRNAGATGLRDDDGNANALTQSFQSNSLNRFRVKFIRNKESKRCANLLNADEECSSRYSWISNNSALSSHQRPKKQHVNRFIVLALFPHFPIDFTEQFFGNGRKMYCICEWLNCDLCVLFVTWIRLHIFCMKPTLKLSAMYFE